MSLLPGGEDGRRSHQLAYAIAVIWLGYQGWVNVFRWHSIEGNLASLVNEINISDEGKFREHFVRVMEQNSTPVRAEDIEIVLDEPANVYWVSVPTAWTLDLFVHRFEFPTVRTTWVKRRPYVPR